MLINLLKVAQDIDTTGMPMPIMIDGKLPQHGITLEIIPLKDITAYEVARLLTISMNTILGMPMDQKSWNELEPEIKRHLKRHEF